MNNTGWVCPRCNAVMSPSVPTCVNCKPKLDTTQWPQVRGVPCMVCGGYHPNGMACPNLNPSSVCIGGDL